MTRILVGDAHRHLAGRRWKAHVNEPLAQVFHASLQLGVEILQVRAAARRVDDQRLEIGVAIHLHVHVPQALGPIEVAVVREQRAATSLGAREPHLAAREL